MTHQQRTKTVLFNRRQLLETALSIGSGVAVALKPTSAWPNISSTSANNAQEIAQDESYWNEVRRAFLQSSSLINLNAAGVSPQPISVQDAVIENYRFANEIPTVNMWEKLDDNRKVIRQKLAELADCSVDEVALNRNSTEGLCTAIYGIDLKPGDEVLVSKWDYYAMRFAWQQREARDKIKLRWVDFDLPETHENIIAKYAANISPRTRVIHLTHLIHYTGQIMPVKEVCALVKGKDIHTIVDAAQTLAHIPLSFKDLNCDYLAVSLHKWLCAPFGSGMLIVRKNRIPNLWPLLAPFDAMTQKNSIGKLDGWSLGTYSSAREQGIENAIEFHNRIGGDAKYRRLQYLKHYWTERAATINGLSFNVPLDDAYSASVVLVSLNGQDGPGIAKALRDDFAIHVVDRVHESINGIRISPQIYTSLSDLDRLVDGLQIIARRSTNLR